MLRIGCNKLGKANTRCLSRLSFPNLLSRCRLSREAKVMVRKVKSEIENAARFENISHRSYGIIQSLIENKEYEVFESRSLILREIMEALRDPNIRAIGLYGMAGTGKTMMAKEVARQTLMEEKLFDELVMLAVSQNRDDESLLQKSAQHLGLKFVESDFYVRADRLRHRLRQGKKVLIIVDDVWQSFDLDDAGISLGKYQKQCKMLLISRCRGVLCKMKVEKNVHVGNLSESESVDLFKKILGNYNNISAIDIVKKCDGLPLAITEVALAERSYPNASQELNISNPNNIVGMHEKVFNSIRQSYNILQSEHKSLLLLWSLFPEDASISIEYLLIYGMGLGFFQEITTFEEARNKVLMLIEYLGGSSLLLDVNNSKSYVKLHNFIRDVCIQIASGDKMEEILLENINKRLISLQLDKTNVVKHPETLKTPQLQLLFCDSGKHEKEPLQIPDLLFQGLKEVRVLDLSRSGLHGGQLPSSFCFLENLKALCLRECKLRDIALIGKLKNLEILDLSYSNNVVELGREIGELTQLRSLNLNYCANLRVIQPNVIRSLTRLEELTVANGFTYWEVEGLGAEKGDHRTNASLSELGNLTGLTALDLCIPDINALPKDIFKLIGEKLKRYYIVLGIHHSEGMNIGFHDLYVASRGLELKLHKNVLDEYGLGTLVEKRCVVMCVEGPDGMDNFVDELHKDNCLSQCEHLQVKNNSELQFIANLVEPKLHPPCVFLSLVSLCLIDLNNLEKICNGKLTSDSLGKLRRIKVSKCDGLKNLFSFSIAKLQLEEIEVSFCSKIEEIFMYQEEGDGPDVENNQVIKIEFPHLRVLRLKNLRNLQQYCRVPERTSQRMPLFNQKVVVSNLEELHLYKLNFGKLMDNFQGFHNLATLEVWYCHNLKSLVSSSMASSLVHLKNLEIGYCLEMEEVVSVDDESEDRGNSGKIFFPALESLRLNGWLPKLKRLKSLQHLFDDKLVLSNFKELLLGWILLERIWDTTDHKLEGRGLHNLTTLTLVSCDGMKTVMSSSIATSLVHLKEMEIRMCDAVEEVITEEHSGDQTRPRKILLPKLETLKLFLLGKLKRFYAGDHIECTSLVELQLVGCYNMETFINNVDSVGKQQKPLFNEKVVVFSKLQELIIVRSNECVNAIWHGEEQIKALANLRELSLINLAELTNLCKESSTVAFEAVETLLVLKCPKLNSPLIMMTSSTTFRNLKSLCIRQCNSLTNLMLYSTAKCLQQLKDITICECHGMTEIIGHETEELEKDQSDHDEIVFSQLCGIRLYGMNSLKSFYGGKNTIRFPSLNMLMVGSCRNMKTFCGTITVTVLDKILFAPKEDWESYWYSYPLDEAYQQCLRSGNHEYQLLEGDVNATFFKLWEDHFDPSRKMMPPSIINFRPGLFLRGMGPSEMVMEFSKTQLESELPNPQV